MNVPEPPEYRAWDKWDCHMSNEWGGISTLPASEFPTRGQARSAFAREWGCSFTEVGSVRKRRMVWDPLEAAITYREERCDDSETPCGAFDSDGEPSGHPCTCPWPKDIHDFWDESGLHCPWREARKDDSPEKVVEMWFAPGES